MYAARESGQIRGLPTSIMVITLRIEYAMLGLEIYGPVICKIGFLKLGAYKSVGMHVGLSNARM